VRRRVAVVSSICFLLFTGLVAAGVFHGLDQYAVDHWMPWLVEGHHPLVQFSTVFVPQTRRSVGGTLAELWTYPAAVFPSAVIVCAVSWWLRDVRLALLWILVNAVDTVGKLVVERPALYLHGRHVAGFDDSLPSGHTLRALVVALALALLWRRGRIAFAWALTVPVALVLLGDHVPTDIVAALLAFVGISAGMYATKLTFTSNRRWLTPPSRTRSGSRRPSSP
jgi:membrane-associated phospholipid phosphatase